MFDGMDDGENEGTMDMVVMDVCPCEDAVTALMDYFLQPLLPVKSTKQHTPTLSQQEAVAKQVHAVVILYNYFHRKKHPQLEFLDFVSFSELMAVLKPQMLAYMKFMQLSKKNEPKDTDVEKQISLTDKCVMNACCICEELDKVQGLPTLEALPVCKVAVMLVDAEEENCYMQFSSVTKGAWSLIEKEVDPVMLTGNDNENSQQPKGVYIRKRTTRKPTSYADGQFQKIAVSAITEAIDINQANLKVIESHLVYSLNKEKAAVRFFIFKYMKSFSEDITLIPIKFVVVSLQGPLVKKDCIGWSVTEAAEYFHMFPYAAIMSAWLSRPRDVTSNEVENTASVSNVLNADKSHMERDVSKTPAADESDGRTSASSSAIHVTAEFNTRDLVKSSMHNTTTVSNNLDCNDFLKNAKEKIVVPDISGAKRLQIGDTPLGSCEKHGNRSQSNIIRVKEEVVETEFHENSGGLNIVVENTCNDDVVAYDHNAPHEVLAAVPQLSEPKYVLHAIASSGNMLTQSALKVLLRKREKLSHQRREIEDELARCDKTIISILSGKEEDLAAKLESLMEACSDMNLASPVLVGSRDGVLPRLDNQASLASPIPVGSRDGVLPRHDKQTSVTPVPAKRKRAADLSPNLQKPCKELDEICHENNWGIPNYRLTQLRGGFQSVVTVERNGSEASEKGEIYSNVFEARESAAKLMLNKLCSINV